MNRLVELRHAGGKAFIVLRRYTIWETIPFQLGMLVGLAVFDAMTTRPNDPQERVVQNLIMLAVMLATGSLAVLAAHLLVGKEEIVTASAAEVVIDRQFLRWPEVRRRYSYQTSRLRNLRAYEPAPRKNQKPDASLRALRPWRVGLIFDYDGKPVRFGTGLTSDGADQVLRAITQVMAAPRL